MLTRVTITGADDGVDPAELQALSSEFPFVEWGILFSSTRRGLARYPSQEWTLRLTAEWSATPFALSAHLCGSFARFVAQQPVLREAAFPRMQFNGVGISDAMNIVAAPDVEVILQARNELELDGACGYAARTDNVSVLFDVSGGTGQAPTAWLTSLLAGVRLGYAGGIGPENVVGVVRELEVINQSSPFWIDMESGVRTGDVFDLARVRAVLEATAPLVRRAS
jgi:N-(5'phosphoribosyl)anthranilate (PRA) isomerase